MRKNLHIGATHTCRCKTCKNSRKIHEAVALAHYYADGECLGEPTFTYQHLHLPTYRECTGFDDDDDDDDAGFSPD